MSCPIDQLIMLLSSDWFLPKWHLLGLEAPPKAKAALQQHCRAMTMELLDGEVNYWMISFDAERIERTQADFFSGALKSKLPKFDIEILGRIADRTKDEENGQHNASLLISLTLLLTTCPTEAADLPLAPSIISTVRSTSHIFELDIKSMATESSCSTSEWDKRLRETTPDLPEYIADFAQDIVTNGNKFFLFWKAVLGNLDTDQKLSLIAWYKTAALKLVGHRIELPFAEI